MDYTDIIKSNLSKLGVSYDSLKPFMIKHLEAIEALIQTKNNVRNVAVESIKNSNYTLSSISKELNMSRTTLYNHEQILKRYIELSVELSQASDPYITISILRDEKSQLLSEIGLLMKRDLDIELLKNQNEQLKAEIKDKNKEIERMHRKIAELSISQIKNI